MKKNSRVTLFAFLLLACYSQLIGQCVTNANFCVPGNGFSEIPFCVTPLITPTGYVGAPFQADMNWAIGRTITYPPGFPITVALYEVQLVSISNLPPGMHVEIRSGNPDDPIIATESNLPVTFTYPVNTDTGSKVGIFGCTRIWGVPETPTFGADSLIVQGNFYIKQIDDFTGQPIDPLIDPDTTGVLGFAVNPRTFYFGVEVRPFTLNVNGPVLAVACGDTISLYADAAPEASEVEYSWAPAATLSNPNSATPKAFPTQTTVYTVTASYGTQILSATVTVEVADIAPPVLAETPLPTCKASAFRLEASGLGEIVWYDQATGGTPIATGAVFTTPVVSQTQKYYAAIKNGGCESPRVEVTVEILPRPTASFEFVPAEPKTGATVLFSNTSSGSGNTYIWDFGDGQNSTLFEPNHVYQQEGVYSIMLVVVDAANCRDTLVRTINVLTTGIDDMIEGRLNIYPNPADGHFTLETPANLPLSELVVYNAMGQPVWKQSLVAENNHRFDFSSFPAGVYRIMLRAGDKLFAGQLVLN